MASIKDSETFKALYVQESEQGNFDRQVTDRKIGDLPDNEVLIRIGAYNKGVDKDLDEAIAKKSRMEEFLKQDSSELPTYDETVQKLINLIK